MNTAIQWVLAGASVIAKLVPAFGGKRRKRALELIWRYGGIDGAHHKQWLLDQLVRELLGSDRAYRSWVEAFEAGEDGPHTYEWDQGVPP